MPRTIDSERSTRAHVFIYESDAEWLRQVFGNTIGVSKAVRELVRAYRRKVEAKAAARQAPSAVVDLSDIEQEAHYR
jgi:hypothetical protein